MALRAGASVAQRVLAAATAAAKRLAYGVADSGGGWSVENKVPGQTVARAVSALVRGGRLDPSPVDPAASLPTRQQNAVTAELLRQAWTLLRPPSTTPPPFMLARRTGKYGDGIFLESTATGHPLPPGQVVAFFPGRVHLGIPAAATAEDPVAAWHRSGSRVGWEQNDKRITLVCGGCIDGHHWEITRNAHCDNIEQAEGTDTVLQPADMEPDPLTALANEHALGHMINHPDSTTVPNIMEWRILLNLESLAAAGIPRARVPYALSKEWYYSREYCSDIPTPSGADIPGLVMMSTRQITPGEELLFDYNLSGRHESDDVDGGGTRGGTLLPTWYVPRDIASDIASEAAS